MLICPTIIHSLNKSCINASIIFNYAFPHVSLKSTRLRSFSLSLDPWVNFIFYFLQSRKLVSEFSNWQNQMSPQVELVCFGQEYTTFPVAHQRPATQMGKQRQSVHLNSSIWAKHTMLEVLSRSGSICVEGMDRWRLDRNPSIWCSILTWNVICPQPWLTDFHQQFAFYSSFQHLQFLVPPLNSAWYWNGSSKISIFLNYLTKSSILYWNKSFLVVVPKPYLLTYSKIFFHNVCKSACLTFLRVNFKLKTETSFNLDFGRGVEVWVSGKRFEG